MDLGISGRVALVGGGSMGMGQAIAKELAAEGAKVVVVARGREAIDATVDLIVNEGGLASGFSADLYSEAGVISAVEHCARVFGNTPDIAIANVYGTDRHNFESASEDIFREGYDKIVMSAVHMARHVLPGMKQRRWGRIVSIGSFCAKKPHWTIPLIVDNVTRAGAVALNKSLSNEFGAFNITVNTIAPGFIATEMANAWMTGMAAELGKDPQTEAAALAARIPIKRLGRPEEIAATCAFLCSDRASYITGQTVMVDGGLVESLY